MKKKILKQIALKSYDGDILDEKTVDSIAEKLNRHDLKLYIKELKNYEKKKNVYISLPHPPSKQEKEAVHMLFPKKKISYIIDPSLVIGVKITNNDLVTEMSLKHTLDDIILYTAEDYD